MKIGTLFTLVFAIPASAQPSDPGPPPATNWTFSTSTGGEDVNWVSATSVDPNADQYDYTYEITYVAVDVIFAGQVIGPNDVTNDIDPAQRFGTGIVIGPAPVILMDQPIASDADGDGTIDVSADMYMQINTGGFGQFDVTNVFLGDVMIDMGWPLGWQNVQIDRIYMDGYMNITPIYIPCPEDTNGDGMVNVTDILAAIGNWGGSGAGDVNGDGIVDVSDLLAIVGVWGPC
ncbi:hypothetical protein H8D29_01670 [PVC group bacterium]|nr:hypothetical protein [PVC group bacterium]